MRMRRIGVCLAVAACAALGTPVVTGVGAPQAHAADSKVLRVAVTTAVASLNPFLAYHQADTEIGRMMYEFLTAYDQTDQHPVPGLAESWQVGTDKLTWTFKIRQGMKWSDDKPITAKDVAFTYNLMLTNAVARTANGNFVSNFDTVTAPDDTTLVVRTKQPQATMLALDVPIVPEHVWASKVDKLVDYTNLDFPVVGSGPFTLVDYKQDQYVKLKANPNFWRGKATVDEVDFYHYDNTDAAAQALIKGDVDLVSKLTAAQFDTLKGKDGITTNKAVGRRFNDLIINPGAQTNTRQPIGDGNPALRDVKLRQAIAQAIDAKTLVDKSYGGYAEPGSSYIPPVFSKWSTNQQRTFDLAAANRTLDEAGYRKGPDGKRLDKEGKPLTLRLIGDSGQPTDNPNGQYLKSWLGQLGIPVDVQLVSGDKLGDVTTAGNYDLSFSTWGVNPDPDAVLTLQTCAALPDAEGKSGTTETFTCDEQYDQLYKAQLSELDEGKRVQEVKQAQQRLAELATSVTFAYPDQLEAYRSDRFSSFAVQPNPGGVITGQNGYWGYYKAVPAAAGTSSGVTPTGLVIGIVVAVVVVAGVVLLVVSRRRKSTADERE
ncbi:ABC transporter substrate-binding protein [Kutzneria albida]|uniref:Solute-binding protein family 5 domain-containing protein n=1 Tax=Kutzneria albida DSM 43870 TaxID=1449976 RepID=W5WB01_9PSEU|nr:ABC transporter substrate-binding protein [Kutzneria albida]AHH97681.1 hypothetical protein KALB_4319 [Kutzneria albida DSM 43870]